MSTVTVVLAIVIIVAICLLRKEDSKRKRYDSARSTVAIVSKDVEDPDCYDNSPPVHKEVFYPPGYDLGNRQFFPIDRSISVQVCWLIKSTFDIAIYFSSILLIFSSSSPYLNFCRKRVKKQSLIYDSHFL